MILFGLTFVSAKLGTVHYLLGVQDRCSVGKTHEKCSCPVNKNFQKSWCPVSGRKEKVHVPYNYTILNIVLEAQYAMTNGHCHLQLGV